MPRASELKRGLTALPEVGEVRCRFEFVFIGPHAKELAEKAASCDQQPRQGEADCRGSLLSTFSGDSYVSTAWVENAAEGIDRKKSKKNETITIYCVVDNEEQPPVCARVKVRIAESFSDHLPQLQSEESLRTTCFVFLWDTRLDIAGDVAPNLESRRVELEFLHSEVQKKKSVGGRKVPKPYVAVLRHASDAPENKDDIKDDLCEEEVVSNPEFALDIKSDPSTARASSKEKKRSFFSERRSLFSGSEKRSIFSGSHSIVSSKAVVLDPFTNLLSKLESMRKVWDSIERQVDFENEFEFFDAFQELAAQMYTSSHVWYSSTAPNGRFVHASRCCAVQ
mmetsp:Transcript_158431/g.279610  ORF Transcript_158431/g.279610 Transcript_158431/m.279610 type:complete len:338 (-) Transcript_158431:62-1075(-)